MPQDVEASAHNRGQKNRTKVKTGCKTCRIRKVKCDEDKPSCRKCVSTGRTCDGYESIFRFAAKQPPSDEPNHFVRTGPHRLPLAHHGHLPETAAAQDIERLNRCFSIKTMLDVKLGCGEEAKKLLEAGLTDTAIQHAILSLRAFREAVDEGGDGRTSVTPHAPNYSRGLKHYNMALGGLMSEMTLQSPEKLRSALSCCQIFISIEQLLGNYDAMAQHIIRGLMIMYEYRARPAINCNVLAPAYQDRLPMLDIFIIKLFAAPCKFAEPLKADSPPRSVQPPHCRTIAPDMRTELTRISLSVLALLDEVEQTHSTEAAIQLLLKRAELLQSLESWRKHLDLAQAKTGSSDPEPISTSFQRLFYHILRIALIGTLDASPATRKRLGTESDKLQSLANVVGQWVRDYRLREIPR
ncbi:hypothetical protein V2A60_005018 [Cordyceps javanica]